MMKHWQIFPLTLLTAACATAQPAPGAAPAAMPATAVTAASPLTQRLDSLARAAFPAPDPGAAILVRRGGTVLLRGGYGMADLALGVPIEPEHVFRIGSVTKQFTAAAILKLVEQGKLSLDDDITRFFPDWPTQGKQISVESLLTHTSGIRSYTGLPAWRALWRTDLAVDSLIGVFRGQPMDFAPGEQWSYNNSAYVLLGAIIEKLSGKTYEQYVEQELFAPLGMTGTRYGRNDEVVPGLVEGYQRRAGAWAPAEYLSLTHPYAAGSILSTVDDIDRWIAALRDGRVLQPASRERAWTPVRVRSGLTTGYGFGWFIGNAFGQRTIEHSGGIHGFTSYQLWLPDQDLSVVVLTNTNTPARSPGAVALELAGIALGAPPHPPAITLSADELQQYVGIYRIDPAQNRHVIRRGDTLFTRVGSTGDGVRLVPVARDEFIVPASQLRLSFDRPTGGPVAGVLTRPRIGPESRAPRIAESEVEEKTVALTAAVLDRYVGTYELMKGFELVVTREGDALMTQATGQGKIPVRAVSQTEFVADGIGARIVFNVDASGRATSLVLHQGGRSGTAPRIR